MSRPAVFVSSLAWFAAASCLYADLPAQAEALRRALRAEIAIKHLSSPVFAERTAAQNELAQLGPAVLPQLRQALARAAEPETRKRLEELIPRLQQAAALEPKRLTMRLKDVPLKTIVEEFSQQSGYKIELVRGGNAEEKEKLLYSLKVERATLWEALQKLCDVAGLSLQEGWYGPDMTVLRLEHRETYNGFVNQQGPFRITLRGFNYYRNIDLTGYGKPFDLEGRRQENLTMNLSIMAEPRLPLLGVGQPIIDEAVDDQGQSLLALGQTRQAPMYMHGYRSFTHHVQANLQPALGGRQIRIIKGKVPVTFVYLQDARIVVDNLEGLKGTKTFRSGNTTLEISDVTFQNNQTLIRMSITEGNSKGRQDYTWANSLTQRLEVRDDKGNRLQQFGGNWNMNVNSVTGTFTFGGTGNVGKGVTLTYYEWLTMTHQVPFAFEDVPLP